jgi:hypothetical protein
VFNGYETYIEYYYEEAWTSQDLDEGKAVEIVEEVS